MNAYERQMAEMKLGGPGSGRHPEGGKSYIGKTARLKAFITGGKADMQVKIKSYDPIKQSYKVEYGNGVIAEHAKTDLIF